MNLHGQQLQVYNYIKEHAPCTVREIRNGTYPAVMKPDMRISEINYAYKKEHGEELIINVGNIKREKLKGLKAPLTKRIQHIEIVDGRAIETFKLIQV